MQLKSFHAIIQAEIEFTREELDQLTKLSEAHYDGRCKAAGQLGGFLYGIKVQLFDQPSVAIQVNWYQLDLLCKIAEAENGFQTLGGVPIPGELGRKLAEIGRQMRTQYERVNDYGIDEEPH